MIDRAPTSSEPPSLVGTRRRLSRRELMAAPADVPAPERARMWSVVAAGQTSMVLLARPGDLRRLDLWVGSEGLVIHGWQDDEDVPAEATHHPLAVAPMAIARLLRLDEGAATAPTGSTPATGIAELIHRVTSGELGRGAQVSVAARQEPRPSTGVVRLHEPGATRWSSFTGDDIDGFTSSEPLSWFAALLRTLGLGQVPRRP